ncbi:MAG: flavin reductase [Treponema sp.]|jgi:flavin reductase (DIM6/NTAB) family NADH-FMN oxidoreductase RutF/rubredoxin|nr:flavin reductase [Treponema sp.]
MDATALFKLSYGLYVVGVKTEKGLGGCVVDALAQVSMGEPPNVILSCMKKNYTNECIKKAREFTLSVLSVEVDPFVIANFGFQSARDAAKWENVPHTIKDGLPLLDGAAAYLRLKVIDEKEFSTHTMFICEVTDAENGANAASLIFGDYQAAMKAAAGEAFKQFKETGKPPSARIGRAGAAPAPGTGTGAKWTCTVCGYVYDGEIPFEDLPADWACPLCGMGKDKFAKMS